MKQRQPLTPLMVSIPKKHQWLTKLKVLSTSEHQIHYHNAVTTSKAFAFCTEDQQYPEGAQQALQSDFIQTDCPTLVTMVKYYAKMT